MHLNFKSQSDTSESEVQNEGTIKSQEQSDYNQTLQTQEIIGAVPKLSVLYQDKYLSCPILHESYVWKIEVITKQAVQYIGCVRKEKQDK